MEDEKRVLDRYLDERDRSAGLEEELDQYGGVLLLDDLLCCVIVLVLMLLRRGRRRGACRQVRWRMHPQVMRRCGRSGCAAVLLVRVAQVLRVLMGGNRLGRDGRRQ